MRGRKSDISTPIDGPSRPMTNYGRHSRAIRSAIGNGDTLVVETVSIKGGIPVDRTGLVFSDELRVTERMRKISETVFENQMTT